MDQIKNYNDFPPQKVRNKEKMKSTWYIPFTNYIIDKAMSVSNKTDTINNINYANGIIDEDSIKYVLAPYGKELHKQKDALRFPHTIRKFDIITGIKERYMGEYIRQYSNYQVYIHNSDSTFTRNQDLKKAVMSELLRKFTELLESEDEDTIKDLNIEKFTKDFIDKWTDERVKTAQQRLDLLNSLTESDIKYIQAFFYWFSCEEVYTYRTVRNNEVYKDIVPPWEYYRVHSGKLFAEDDDMGMRHYKMSINQIIDSEELDPKDVDYLQALAARHSTPDGVQVPSQLLESREAFNLYAPKDVGTINLSDPSNMVDVYHCVAKTQTLIYDLTYYDFLTGEVNTIEVDQDYKLDKASGDISLEPKWINEVWESKRYGGKFEGVYKKAEPCLVQRQEVNNSSECKLPYNGITGLLHNNKINPIPKRLILYQELIQVYMFQLEKTVSKFKSFNIIPESLMADSDELTLKERLAYANIDDILMVNDENIDQAVYQAIKNLYNQGAERLISVLMELVQFLIKQAMDVANMNEQRYGDINHNAGKSVTEYAITKATTGSILMFEMFNKFRERDHQADLDHSKVAWIDGKRDSYIDKNTNEIVYVDIDGASDLNTNIGVFIKNSNIEEEKLKLYRELAFSASQNGDFDIAADAIHLENSTELRRLIKDAVVAKREFDQNMEAIRNQTAESIQKSNEAIEAGKLQHEKDVVMLKEDEETKRLIMKLEVELIKIKGDLDKTSTANSNGGVNKELLDKANLELKKSKMELDRLKTLKSMKQSN